MMTAVLSQLATAAIVAVVVVVIGRTLHGSVVSMSKVTQCYIVYQNKDGILYTCKYVYGAGEKVFYKKKSLKNNEETTY